VLVRSDGKAIALAEMTLGSARSRSCEIM